MADVHCILSKPVSLMGVLALLRIFSNMPKRPRIRVNTSSTKIVARVKKLEKKVRMNSPDLKHHRLSQSSVDITNSWSKILLNGIGTGETDTLRSDSTIHLKSLELRYSVQVPAITSSEPIIRFMIVYDKNPKGVAVNPFPDIVSVDNAVLAFRTLPINRRYVILKDKTFTMVQYDGGSNQRLMTSKIVLNLRGKRQDFLSTGNTITAIRNGSIYFLWTTNITVTAQRPVMSTRIQVRFIDT